MLRDGRKAVRELLWARMLTFATDQTTDFKRKILQQDFEDFQRIYYKQSGTNLSPRWLRRKARAGADLRTMLATHWYIRNIRVWTRHMQRVRVGFHPRIRARNLKGEIVRARLNLVARVHEYGSVKAHTPRRAHWGPHYKVMHQAAVPLRRNLAKLVAGRMRKAL